MCKSYICVTWLVTMAAVSNEEFLQYTLLSKNVLSLEEQELYEVSQLAGVILDPSVFK